MLFCVAFYDIDHERPRISSSIPLIFMSILMLTPDDLGYCSFNGSLKSNRVISPTLFFFQIAWAILGLLHVHINNKISLSISTKTTWDFDSDYIESIAICGEMTNKQY